MFLSRYDGLRYFRVTPLGAVILGKRPAYNAPQDKPSVSLTVLRKSQVRIDAGKVYTRRNTVVRELRRSRRWPFVVDQRTQDLRSVERGASLSDFRAFLAARDLQPLSETVGALFAAMQRRGSACFCKGSALLIECLSSEIAAAIATDSSAEKLCQRTGDKGLVVRAHKEKYFREALNALGYGMPLV